MRMDVLMGRTVAFRSIRPSCVLGLGGLDEIGSLSVPAHVIDIKMWF